MDVDGVEARAIERRGHLDLPVHALLPQDRDARTCPRRDERRRDVVRRIEPDVRMQAGVREIVDAGEFLVGARRVVAQLLDRVADRRPVLLECRTGGREDLLAALEDAQIAFLVDHADLVDACAQAGLGEGFAHDLQIVGAHLHDSTEFLVEERGRGTALHRERTDLHVHADARREHHFRERHRKAAVRTVVVGEQPAVGEQCLDRLEERAQLRGIVDVRREIADRIEHLREHRGTEPVATRTEIDEQQARVLVERPQFGRQRRAHILDGREGRHDERQRRRDLALRAVDLPRRAHRQAVLADGDAHAERGAQFHPDGVDRVEQRGVLAGLAGRRHPVGRELHARDGPDARRGDVRQRFADGHPARRRRVEHRDGRAFAHRHRLAAIAVEAHERDGDVRDGHLPATDELVARREAADAAVTDVDEERLARDGREAQHALEGVLQGDAGRVEHAADARFADDVAVHARRLAEQHAEIHVDRCVLEFRVLDDEALLFRRVTDDGERAALAGAQRLERREAIGMHRQDVAFLGFVAPDLQRRHAGFLGGNLPEVEARTASGAVHDFGQRVRQTASTDVVDRQDRVVVAERPAAVDDFLRAALDLGVAALHGIEVEVLGVRARRHARRGAAAEADQHAGAAELHERRAHRQRLLLDLVRADVAEPARDHDRLVVTEDPAVDLLFVRAEVAREIRTPELVVERRAADRALDHDVERRRDAAGLARIEGFPRFGLPGDAQVRRREAREPGLRLRATTRRALVADLAASARRSTRIRRDRGRMVVRLDLHQDVRRFDGPAVDALGVGPEARHRRAFHHGGVVGVRDDRVLRMHLVRVPDHPEERQRLFGAVDRPRRVEDLVAAMLGIRLREHHQLDVRRIATLAPERLEQVVDLVGRQRETQLDVRLFQRLASAREHIDGRQALRGHVPEELVRLREIVDDDLRHPVVQLRLQRSRPGGVHRLARQDRERESALDPEERVESAVARDLGGLRRPRRDGPEAREHEVGRPRGQGRTRRRAVGQQLVEAGALVGCERPLQLREMPIACVERADRGFDRPEDAQELLQTEAGQGIAPGKMEDLRHWAGGEFGKPRV